MTLGSFQPKTRITGDKVDYAKYAGRPLLVRVTEYQPEFSSQQYPEPSPAVFADVVDLISGQIFINTLWGAGAIVDNLKDYAGTEVVLPVMIVQKQSKQGGRTYFTLDALDAQTTANAGAWYEANWGAVNAERARREAAANAAAPAQGFGAPAQAPVQQAPAQGFGAPAQAPVQQAPAQGFGAPAQAPVQQGFGAPVQQAPAQGFGAPAAGGGMFSDTPPAQAPGQGFGAPQGVDPALAAQALQNLNGQLGQPQG